MKIINKYKRVVEMMKMMNWWEKRMLVNIGEVRTL